MIDIEIKHYAYNTGAWVSRTPFTIKSTQVKQLFKDQNPFGALAEKKFMGK
jgi:hypothetical protein